VPKKEMESRVNRYSQLSTVNYLPALNMCDNRCICMED